MSRLLDQIIAWGLLVTAVFMALAHGAVEPWSVALGAAAVIVLFELWAIKMVADRKVRLRVPNAFWPLVALILLGFAQSISWAGGDGRRASFSLDVDATRMTVAWLVLLAVAFLIAANFWTGQRRLRQFGWALTIYGTVLAIFALLQKFTWTGGFYWLRPMGTPTSVFGPFINHNLYAGYLELLIPIPIGMLLGGVVRGAGRLFCLFAAVMMSLSVIFSLSRGGMISVAASLVFVGVMGARLALERRREYEGEWDDDLDEKPRRFVWLPQAGAVGAIFAAILIGLLWLGPDTIASRITQTELISANTDIQAQTFYASRGWIWRDSWAIFKDRPLSGVGLGAYETAFPKYTQTDGTIIVRHAHNDYLQILADGGIVGGVIALWFIFVVFRAMVRGLRARDPWAASLALGAGTSIFALLVHSVFDFNLQIPGTALMFLVLAGLVAGLGEAGPAKGAISR
jgi:O-antigen ligase